MPRQPFSDLGVLVGGVVLSLRLKQASIPKHRLVQGRRDVTEFGMGGVYQDIAFDPRHDARHDQGDAPPLDTPRFAEGFADVAGTLSQPGIEACENTS